MKKLLIGLLAIGSLSVSASPVDLCKSTALKVASALDKVYTPKPKRGTKISSSLIATSADSYKWRINFLVPSAGGQTTYEIELGNESCDLKKVDAFAE